jgi:hypothetical protein
LTSFKIRFKFKLPGNLTVTYPLRIVAITSRIASFKSETALIDFSFAFIILVPMPPSTPAAITFCSAAGWF